jgi:hypothetical protein
MQLLIREYLPGWRNWQTRWTQYPLWSSKIRKSAILSIRKHQYLQRPSSAKSKEHRMQSTNPARPEKLKHALRVVGREQRTEMHYLPIGKLPRAIPTGYVLVHNHIRHAVGTPCGINGFRAWMQKPNNRLERCKCGWSGLPHYHVKRNATRD